MNSKNNYVHCAQVFFTGMLKYTTFYDKKTYAIKFKFKYVKLTT